MKKQIRSAMVVVMLAGSVQAALYTEDFNHVNTSIPDGNPVGATFSGTVSDVPAGMTVGGLTVTLNISGGCNGNLYSYLVAPGGAMVVLLNQPGVGGGNLFGASGAGMNITLQDGPSDHGSIQNETSGSVLSGTYNAAGTLVSFGGSAADGNWELFFADEVSGGGTSTLNSWSLGITAVPEPVNVALAIFGGLFVFRGAFRRLRNRPAQTTDAL